MTDERDLILYYLRIHFSNQPEVELKDEQQENIDYMHKVVDLNPVLTTEERNILNVAYKNAITSHRKAISDVVAIMKDESQSGWFEKLINVIFSNVFIAA